MSKQIAGKLIVITGKTASGKDTVVSKLLIKYPDLKKIVTTTTRAPRKEEVNEVDYNFITEAEFRQKISNGELIEYVEYGGNLYGTEKSRINPNEDLIWKIDPSMAGKAKEVFPHSIVIYITADNQTILKRLKARTLSESEIAKRMQDDQKFWDQFNDKYDYIVKNAPGKLNQTVDEIVNIISPLLKLSF